MADNVVRVSLIEFYPLKRMNFERFASYLWTNPRRGCNDCPAGSVRGGEDGVNGSS
jgi:hypothetical protein